MIRSTRRRHPHRVSRFRRLAPEALAGFLLAMTVLAPAGCGIFDTRDPENPEGDQIEFNNPTEPRIVLENIQHTFVAKSTDNYENSLIEDTDGNDGFAFTPDPGDESCGELLQWNKEEEVRATDAFLSTPGEIELIWTPRENDFEDLRSAEDGPNGEVQVYYEDLAYELKFTNGQESVTYGGKVDLYFREINGIYQIYKWIDKNDGSGCTWGLLRCFDVQFDECG